MNYSCGYVPPYILENMARAGIEEALSSIEQSNGQRETRNENVAAMAALTIPPAGKAGREIWDCQHKNQQKVKFVRGEGDAATGDESVKNTYDFSGVVRKYYKDVLGRDSIDNLGMNLVLNVHYGVKYQNAFWDGNEMVFGDGDGNIFINFDKSLDVVAHELAHGVTQHNANLVYKGQSGALNEHFSDVFGTAITQWANKETAQTADWLVGDEIMGPELFGESLRSMIEPGTAYDNPLMGKDPQPNHMDRYFTGPGDNYGVHINSGIPNKAFYLVSMKIGTDKAALIWYHALQNLWSTALFNDAVKVIARSAQILIKDGTVPPGSTQVVRAAFKAVGLPTP
jgi:Zn-dependent metalloprotease